MEVSPPVLRDVTSELVRDRDAALRRPVSGRNATPSVLCASLPIAYGPTSERGSRAAPRSGTPVGFPTCQRRCVARRRSRDKRRSPRWSCTHSGERTSRRPSQSTWFGPVVLRAGWWILLSLRPSHGKTSKERAWEQTNTAARPSRSAWPLCQIRHSSASESAKQVLGDQGQVAVTRGTSVTGHCSCALQLPLTESTVPNIARSRPRSTSGRALR